MAMRFFMHLRPLTVVVGHLGAGIVALVLIDTSDKRALWAYAVAALVAVALPPARQEIGHRTVIGLVAAFLLTIGVPVPALKWASSLDRPACRELRLNHPVGW